MLKTSDYMHVHFSCKKKLKKIKMSIFTKGIAKRYSIVGQTEKKEKVYVVYGSRFFVDRGAFFKSFSGSSWSGGNMTFPLEDVCGNRSLWSRFPTPNTSNFTFFFLTTVQIFPRNPALNFLFQSRFCLFSGSF